MGKGGASRGDDDQFSDQGQPSAAEDWAVYEEVHFKNAPSAKMVTSHRRHAWGHLFYNTGTDQVYGQQKTQVNLAIGELNYSSSDDIWKNLQQHPWVVPGSLRKDDSKLLNSNPTDHAGGRG